MIRNEQCADIECSMQQGSNYIAQFGLAKFVISGTHWVIVICNAHLELDTI